MNNPFTPAFGKIPPVLAGREYLEVELLSALDNGPGDPSQTAILVGARGTGKTATLGYMADQARAKGWIAASTTAIPGMLEDIIQQSMKAASEVFEPKKRKISSASVSIAGFGASIGLSPEQASTPLNWRSRITVLLEALEEHGTGLLITVDEVDPKLNEMVQLVTAYQHLVTEDRKVALLMAGLPHKVSSLVSGESVSFLRRAARKELGNVADYEIAAGFKATAKIGGKQFADDALSLAVRETQGLPFMMQLIGFRSWAASLTSETITLQNVQEGFELASSDMKERVLRSTLDELSEKDLAFLEAMLKDEHPSRTTDIAERLGTSSSVVSTYRRRLLDAGVIQSAGRSRLTFALPLMREYLPDYLEQQM